MKSQQRYYHLNEMSNCYDHFSEKEIMEQQRNTLLKKYYTAIKNGRVFKNAKKIFLKIKKIEQEMKNF